MLSWLQAADICPNDDMASTEGLLKQVEELEQSSR